MTPEQLQAAVEELFRLNNYDVSGPLQVRGASVDIKAVPRGDLFARPIYVEVTVERVNTAKFGKDLTKLGPCREESPGCDFLIISPAGFTQEVLERAPASGVTCLSYDELFGRFQRFSSYERLVLTEGQLAEELIRLEEVYEEPNFEESSGRYEPATTQLIEQLQRESGEWLIVVGEYGTGKTALTKIVLRRLMQAHKEDPRERIPVRIELRDFTRQFDSTALLHRFLDQNGLGHVPVEFFFSLIRKGRVVLLLDGYDEMAQYMHLLERRVCLEALADLGREGAVGVLTSRPNYFSEAEELNVLETLYTTLGGAGVDQDVLTSELALDELLQRQFLDRREKRLQDLDLDQTRALVERRLKEHPERASVVLGLLQKVSRPTEDGRRSLSGKPVIISYLVELADSLANDESPGADAELSEFDCFKLIIDRLMLRDKLRAPMLGTEERRSFLRELAVLLSGSTTANCSEAQFIKLISNVFDRRLMRLPPAEREADRQRLFADLRSSATLTRVSVAGEEGWRFSHNSLREYLVVEYLLDCLQEQKEPQV